MDHLLAYDIHLEKRVILLEKLNTDLFNEIHRLREKLDRATLLEEYIHGHFTIAGVVRALKLHGRINV